MGKFIIKTVSSGVKFDFESDSGQVLATSEVYTSDAGCINGIESVRRNAPIANCEDKTDENAGEAVNPKFEIYLDKKQSFRFRLKARNGEIIAVSDSYPTKEGCKKSIEYICSKVKSAEIERR